MAVRFKLGYYSPVPDDPAQGTYVGYFPRMAEGEVWIVVRGVGKVNKQRLAREQLALVVGEGRVVVVAEIRSVSVHKDRVALDGMVLTEGHPVREAWIGEPDPVVNASQNPVGYCDLPPGGLALRGKCTGEPDSSSSGTESYWDRTEFVTTESATEPI